MDRMGDTHVELFIAPALVHVAAERPGGSALMRAWTRADATGTMGRAFRRWSQRLDAVGGGRYAVLAEVRNNKGYPLTAGVKIWLEVVWMDAHGTELGRAGSERLAGELSTKEWTRIELPDVRADEEAVGGVVSVILVPCAEDSEGSVWVRGLQLRAGRSGKLAVRENSSRVHEMKKKKREAT